jgi:hypothetical protein
MTKEKDKVFSILMLIAIVIGIILFYWAFIKCQPHYIEIGDGTGLEQVDNN